MQRATTLLEVTGFSLIAAGFWSLSVTAGLIASGVACVVVGGLAGRDAGAAPDTRAGGRA
jgi:hypothetical protein